MTGPFETEESRRAVNRLLLEALGAEELRLQLERRGLPEAEIERILRESESTPDEGEDT
jgi:hypothetical protein